MAALKWRYEFLADLMARRKFATLVEVGCRGGRTTGHVLKALPDVHVIAVDPWIAQPDGGGDRETYEKWDFCKIERDFWINVGEDKDRCTMLRMKSVDAAQYLERQQFDLVFIDARHDYPSVKADIAAWWPRVRPGGVLAGHDFSDKWPGVMRAVTEVFGKVSVGIDSVWHVGKDLGDREMHKRMERGWSAGLPFTVCGNGSLPRATENIRRVLPEWCKKYRIQTVHDAGAGDMAWRRDMVWDVVYRPFDLIPREQGVTQIDITTEALPPCDLILCRMVLNHIQPRVEQTLELFRQSGTYLAATQFQGENLPERSRQFVRLDLRKWLGEPIESTADGTESACRLALWKL